MLFTTVLSTLALPLLALAAPLGDRSNIIEERGNNARFTWYDTEVGLGACGEFNENWKSEFWPNTFPFLVRHVADGRPWP